MSIESTQDIISDELHDNRAVCSKISQEIVPTNGWDGRHPLSFAVAEQLIVRLRPPRPHTIGRGENINPHYKYVSSANETDKDDNTLRSQCCLASIRSPNYTYRAFPNISYITIILINEILTTYLYNNGLDALKLIQRYKRD